MSQKSKPELLEIEQPQCLKATKIEGQKMLEQKNSCCAIRTRVLYYCYFP